LITINPQCDDIENTHRVASVVTPMRRGPVGLAYV